jgi:hypothetical protein
MLIRDLYHKAYYDSLEDFNNILAEFKVEDIDVLDLFQQTLYSEKDNNEKCFSFFKFLYQEMQETKQKELDIYVSSMVNLCLNNKNYFLLQKVIKKNKYKVTLDINSKNEKLYTMLYNINNF